MEAQGRGELLFQGFQTALFRGYNTYFVLQDDFISTVHEMKKESFIDSHKGDTYYTDRV